MSSKGVSNMNTLRRCSAEETEPSRVNAQLPLPQLEFKQASTWEEVRSSYGLLYRSYRDRGLIDSNKIRLRYTYFNLLPCNSTFVAKAGDEVIATLSALIDTSPFGLPMQELYAAELDALRARGRKLAEGSGLAVDARYRPIGMHIVMNLVKMAILYARKMGADHAVIACHPRHSRFYRRVFLFERFGEKRSYQAVNNAPAVALGLDIGNLEQIYKENSEAEGTGIYRFFFTDEIFRCPQTVLQSSAYSQEILRRLCALQPSVMSTLEERSPGLVRELTGWSLFETERSDALRTRFARTGAVPAFVPA